MSPKPVVGVFACTLQAVNPRGTGRLFRSMAEELANNEEFHTLVLVERMDRPAETVYTAMELKQWLALNPVIYTNDVTGKKKRKRRNQAVPELSGWQRITFRKIIDHTLHPAVLGQIRKFMGLARKGASFVKQKLLSKIRRRPAHAPAPGPILGPELCVAISELDLVLNFWWFYSDNHLFTMPHPKRARVISWFLDAIPLRVGHFDVRNGGFANHYRALVSQNLALADHVVCISETSQEDLERFFNVPVDRSSVVPCGITLPAPERPDQKNVRERQVEFSQFEIDASIPVVMSIGVNDPWKNTLNVMRAAAQLADEVPPGSPPPFQLVFVGEMTKRSNVEQYGFVSSELAKRIPVTFTGYVTDEDMNRLCKLCLVFMFPSLWEGFGIPPLDAMGRGIPVVTSTEGPLPDVCGDSVFYCDPYDPSSIAEQLENALGLSKAELAAYQRQAVAHAKTMTWKHAGESLSQVMHAELAKLPRWSETSDQDGETDDFGLARSA